MRFCLFILGIGIAAALSSCSQGRGDLLSPVGGTGDFGGSLKSGGNGANELVEEKNKLLFSRDLLRDIYPSFLQSLRVSSNLPVGADELRILGNYQGYAVASRAVLASGNSMTVDHLELTYYDYSSSGKIFVGGRLTVSGSFLRYNGRWILSRLIIERGSLVFAGAYMGSVTFDILLLFFDESGTMIDFIAAPDIVVCQLPVQGNIDVTSGDLKLKIYPYLRRCNDLESGD